MIAAKAAGKDNTVDKITHICQILEDKRELFLEYEKATQALLQCDAEDAENYITKRGKLANEIDELTEAFARACDGEPAKELLLETASGKADFSGVPSEYQCIYYSGQNMRSVIGRIAESEKQVIERLESLRDEAREAIKQNQDIPKIKKYLTDLSDPNPAIRLKDEKV